MNTTEGHGGHKALEHSLFGGNYVHVLGTDDHVHGLVRRKSAVHTIKYVSCKFGAAVGDHNAVHNVRFPDKIGNKCVDRLVVDIGGRADLLNVTVLHDHHGIRHRESFLLIVRHVNKGDPRLMLDILQLVLHILAKLEVKCRKRLVQKKHLGLIDECTRNCHALLLTARERADTATLKATQVDHGKHLLDLRFDLTVGTFSQSQTKRNIIKHVQVWEQRVTLKHGIDLTLIRRQIVDPFSVEIHVARIGCLKAADDAKRGSLSTARGAEERNKLLVVDLQAHVVQNGLSVKRLGDPLELNQNIFVHSA